MRIKIEKIYAILFSVLLLVSLLFMKNENLIVAVTIIVVETVRTILENVFNKAKTKSFYRSKDSTFIVMQSAIIIYFIVIYFKLLSTSGFQYFKLNISIGLILIFVGIIIRCVSFRNIGSYFSLLVEIQEEHKLIIDGIYGCLRHPLYLGMIIIYLSYSIMTESILGLILFLVVVASYIQRITYEEILLGKQFGEAYAEYCEKTARLIPHIW